MAQVSDALKLFYAGDEGYIMAGNKKASPLEFAQSTPAHKGDGVAAKTPYAAFAKYEVNIRGFHPNKNFEKLGFRFHGDNRGFSLGDSWFGLHGDALPTSRIWQRYLLDTSSQYVGALTKSASTALRTESNFSDSGPGIWKLLSIDGETYDDEKYKPRGILEAVQVEAPHGGQKILRLRSHFAGENHAFITSESQQTVFGTTTIPTLDVFNELFVRVERIRLYMDITSYTYGDGFPNCESYIKDSAGKKIFLGSHIRIGYPATHLWGKQKRLIWANAIRIEIDKDGNFGERLWVFAQVLGGPPDLRDEYPTTGQSEVCTIAAAKPKFISGVNLRDKDRGKFFWNCGDPSEIIQHREGSSLPLYLSAHHIPREVLCGLIDATWNIGPRTKTTVTEWNDYHLHRDPNEGRDRDDPEYQIEDEKWQRPKPKKRSVQG